MICQRCAGLIVREQYDNLEFDSAGYEASGWRCLNRGAIVDPMTSQRNHILKPRLKKLVMAT